MAELGAVNVRIGADTSGLDSGVKRARTQMRQLGAEAREGAATLAKFGAAATAAGVAITAGIVRASSEAITQQTRLARSLGATNTQVVGLSSAFRAYGLQTEDVADALNTLSDRAQDAASGQESMADDFRLVGVEIDSLRGKKPVELFSQFANAVQNTEDPSRRTAAAVRIFGDDIGRRLLPLLMEGDGAIQRFTRQAENMGLAISDVDAVQVEQASIAMAQIQDAASAVGRSLTVELAPIIQGVAELFMQSAEAAGGIPSAVEDAVGPVQKAIGFMADSVEGVKRVFEVAGDEIVIAFSGMAAGLSGIIANMVEDVDSVASALGSDLFTPAAKAVREFSDQNKAVMREARQNIEDTLAEPMPSTLMDQFIADVREKTGASAKEMAKVRQRMQEALSGAGGEGEDTSEAAKEREKQQARLDAIRGALNQEFAIRQEHNERMRELEQLNKDKTLLSDQEFNELKVQAEKRLNERLLELEKRRGQNELSAQQKWDKSKINEAWGAGNELISAASQTNEGLAKAAKVSGAAQAFISTLVGQAEALKLPFPANLAAVAKVGAVGFGLVSAIKSTNVTSGGGGGRSSAGSAAAAGGGGGQPRQTVERVQEISITGFNPDQLVSGSAVDGIIDAINERSRDGKVVLARG